MLMRRVMRAREPTARQNEGEGTIMTIDDLAKFFASNESAGTEAAAMKSSPVAAAHRIWTNAIAAMPIDLYRKSKGKRQEVDDHPALYPLTVRANAHMSPMICRKVLASTAFWHGEAFAYIDRSARIPQHIPMPPGHTLYVDPDTGDRWYMFTVDVGGKSETRKFHEDELLHVYFDTTDGKRGVGLLEMARESLKTELNAQKYAGKFYTQGARPSGVIEVPTKLSPENKDKVRESFERAVGGMSGAYRVAVMDIGMKYTQLGLSQKDAQYIEQRQFTVEEIARFTGIPMHKLQAGKQSYESNEAQGIDFVVSTLQAVVVQWEQEMRYKLLAPDEQKSMYFKFNRAAEMRGDNESRARFYQIMVANSIMTPNECRALEDRDTKENGDELLTTKNLTTLQNIVAGGEVSE